jgi:hypothetical protein
VEVRGDRKLGIDIPLDTAIWEASTAFHLETSPFVAAQTVKACGYSFEVENDHQDWDQAIDGIRTIERQLAALRGEA